MPATAIQPKGIFLVNPLTKSWISIDGRNLFVIGWRSSYNRFQLSKAIHLKQLFFLKNNFIDNRFLLSKDLRLKQSFFLKENFLDDKAIFGYQICVFRRIIMEIRSCVYHKNRIIAPGNRLRAQHEFLMSLLPQISQISQNTHKTQNPHSPQRWYDRESIESINSRGWVGVYEKLSVKRSRNQLNRINRWKVFNNKS